MSPPPDSVRDRIASTIRDRGPIPFDEFMELALYGSGGYYEQARVGADGDFITSPHVHPWFAYAMARAFASLHEALGSPDPGRLVEVGAGDGTLARAVLEILSGGGRLEYVAVERSAGARSALADAGVQVRASIEELACIDDAVVVANELLDNLPFRRMRGAAGGTVEVRVGLDGERLVEMEVPPSLDAPAPRLGPGEEKILPTGAVAFVDALAARMRRSYALLIDYSAERGRDVHGYRAQRVVEDVLAAPATVDITAGVDFDAIEDRARADGLTVLGRATQRRALLSLGFADWSALDRARFASDRSAGARAWMRRTRASMLIEENGPGAHRWLLFATHGLPVPGWFADASSGPSPH